MGGWFIGHSSVLALPFGYIDNIHVLSLPSLIENQTTMSPTLPAI